MLELLASGRTQTPPKVKNARLIAKSAFIGTFLIKYSAWNATTVTIQIKYLGSAVRALKTLTAERVSTQT